jgi:probable rRNA maturation factor
VNEQNKMAIEIMIDSEYESKLDTTILQNAIQITLVSANKANADVTLKITGDEEMHHLNQTYRNIDHTTDVLSFNQDYIDPETGRLYLGDVVISYAQAQAQAEANQRPLIEECNRLAIHGILHLLGYDHSEPEEKEIMWKKQENLLDKVMESLQGE